MFIISAVKDWMISWLIHFWILFITLLASKDELVPSLRVDENIIYIDADRIPTKRLSIDGRDDYLRAVENVSQIRKPPPKKNPLKRTASDGGVNSIVNKFENRSKSLEPTEQDKKLTSRPIGKLSKRQDAMSSTRGRTRPVKIEQIHHDVDPKCPPSESDVPDDISSCLTHDDLSEDTDILWEQLVAKYSDDGTTERNEHIKNRAKPDMKYQSSDNSLLELSSPPLEEQLDRYLARLDEPADLDTGDATGSAREIEEVLEKALHESNDNPQDQIFIMFEDSLDNDSDEIEIPDSEHVMKLETEIEPAPTRTESILQQHSELPIDPVSSFEERSPDYIDISDTDVPPNASDAERPPTGSIIIRSVVTEPCNSASLDLEQTCDLSMMESEFNSLCQHVEQDETRSLDALYEQCIPVSLHEISRSTSPEQLDNLLPDISGCSPASMPEQLLDDILPTNNENNMRDRSDPVHISELPEVPAAFLVDQDSPQVEQKLEEQDDSNHADPMRSPTPDHEDSVTIDDAVIPDHDIAKSSEDHLPRVSHEDSVESYDENSQQQIEAIRQQSEEVCVDIQTDGNNLDADREVERALRVVVTELASFVDLEIKDGELPIEIDVHEDVEDLQTEIDRVLNSLPSSSESTKNSGLLNMFLCDDDDLKEDIELVMTPDIDDDEQRPLDIWQKIERKEAATSPSEHCSSPDHIVNDIPIFDVGRSLDENLDVSDPGTNLCRMGSFGAHNVRKRLADIPEEQEPCDSTVEDDDELSDDCFEIEQPKRITNQLDEYNQHSPDVPVYLDEVKDLLVPRARRTKQRRFKELDDIMKMDDESLCHQQNIFTACEDLTQISLPSSPSEEPLSRCHSSEDVNEDPSDPSLSFSRQEKSELLEIKQEENALRSAQSKELERYLTMPSALTEQELEELQDILAEEESDKNMTAIGESRLAGFLADIRSRFEEGEDNDLDHYMNMPLQLSNDEQQFLEHDEAEKCADDFSTDEEYKEYIRNKYLEELEEERMRVEEEFNYSESSASYDSEYEESEDDELAPADVSSAKPSSELDNTKLKEPHATFFMHSASEGS